MAYEEWADEGLVFTDEELRTFDAEAWAQAKVERLCGEVLVVERIKELPGVKNLLWWTKVGRGLWQSATWLCKAVPLVGLNHQAAHTLPSGSSAVGRELFATARTWEEDPVAWLGGRGLMLDHELRYVATLRCRMPLAHRSKNDIRQMNRLCNAVNQDRERVEIWTTQFWSTST